jgi:hypothetical protein
VLIGSVELVNASRVRGVAASQQRERQNHTPAQVAKNPPMDFPPGGVNGLLFVHLGVWKTVTVAQSRSNPAIITHDCGRWTGVGETGARDRRQLALIPPRGYAPGRCGCWTVTCYANSWFR